MHDLIMALMPGADARALVLVRSLRAFGGALADIPVWFLEPAEGGPVFADAAPGSADELAALGVEVVPFDLDPEVRQFPLASKVFAAAAAETHAAGRAGRLAWLDPDTLFIQPPEAFLLPEDKQIAYCPVHHRLIGPHYDQPLDEFWSLIYARCGVPEGRAFPMQTIVDAATVYPYINAGSLVVHPEAGLLRRWMARFAAEYRDPAYLPFYEKHVFYRIFMHQAILAGMLLAALEPAQWIELPRTYNYPLHLYADHDPAQRPASINDLVTCRYEDVFSGEDWPAALPVHDPLAGWIRAQFSV